MGPSRVVSGRLRLPLLVLLTYVAGAAALLIARGTGTTAAWFPAAGVAVAAVMLSPRSQWRPLYVGLFLAFALANLTAGRSVGVAALLGLVDVVETAVITLLLMRYVGRRIRTVQDVWRVFAIAAVGGLTAALLLSLVYTTLLDGDFGDTLVLTLPSHAASVMLIAPLAMLGRRWHRLRREDALETAAQVLTLTLATVATFGAAELTLGFAPLPVIVWAAVRFREWVVVIEQVVFATALTLLTQLDLGPFSRANDDPGLSTQHAQLYLICMALIGLPLVWAMRQHDDALARISQSERTFRRNFTESRTPVAIVSWDGSELRFQETNPASDALLRRTSAELVHTRVERVLDTTEVARAAADIASGRADSWSGSIAALDQPRTRIEAVLSPIEHVYGMWLFSLLLRDVTEAQEMQERLQAEKDFTRAVIDTASSMLVVTDQAGTVVLANPATTEQSGFTEAEIVGRPFWEVLIPERHRDSVRRRFADPARVPHSGEAQFETKDGASRTVIFSSNFHQATPDAPVLFVLSATDVTAARENAGLVNHLLRSARTIAFIGTDLDGRVTLFNTGAEQMLGTEASEATGRELVEFIAKDDLVRESVRSPGLGGFAALVEPALTEAASDTRDWTLLPRDRQPVKVSMTTNPVTDTFGQLIGYLFVARDVTDTRRSQEILVKALRREREVVGRLKDLDRAKDDFVSTVSHELRTPMSSIIGSAEMLADGMLGELKPEQQRMVSVISRNGDRLLSLADDLLMLAGFDAGTWQQQTARVELSAVVADSANAVSGVLAGRDLAVEYDVPAEPVAVMGDATHLERAITNLLTNAVKFTPDGGRVTLTVRADEPGSTAAISVADTGLGIPEEELENVFARFFRSTVVQERAIQGSGLGLAIVKSIVESHDGVIDVRSRPGEGTTFTIRLPLA